MTIIPTKRIIIGITGSIAAYKSPDLVRKLKNRGAEVRVVMSQIAKKFITPLTLQAVSGNPVFYNNFDTEVESGMNHIELARWANILLIAPATSNCIAKLANGQADDLLSTLTLVTDAKVILAPAMNQNMWKHPATQNNIDILISRGVRILGPGNGVQVCNEIGLGRMLEPKEITNIIFEKKNVQCFNRKNILITAGPTWESIDPIRGITNHSSGKMGYALAEAARDYGDSVTLISGPVNLNTPKNIKRINIISAQEMRKNVLNKVIEADVFISVAAVADYRPVKIHNKKLKKNKKIISIKLIKNPDILTEVAERYNEKLYTVGFAAETENMLENARKKLKTKKVDMIAANCISGKDSAFFNQNNEVTLVYSNREIKLKKTDKYSLALKIMKKINHQFEKKYKNLISKKETSRSINMLKIKHQK